jgi:hypothetical protein
MATRQQIAKEAAKIAAVSTYKAIMSAKVTKVAGTKYRSAPPSIKDIAKTAAAAAYNSVIKVAQFADPKNINPVGAGEHNIGNALQQICPDFNRYIQSDAYQTNPQVPADVKNFAKYVKSGGKGESWAGAESWPAIVDALISDVSSDYQDGLRTYLNTL